jgi:glutathione reductase (NADPH)
MIAIAFRYVRRIAVDYRVAETVAWSKIIVDRSGDLMGVSSSMPAQKPVNIFGLAIWFGITASQLMDNVYAYPTFSSDIKHMFAHA